MIISLDIGSTKVYYVIMQGGRQEYANYILSQMGDIVGSINNIIGSYGLFIILGYGLFIAITIVIIIYINRTNKHIISLLNKTVDTIIYKQNLLIYKNKEDMYKTSESLPILYSQMNIMTTDITQRDYRISYPLIKKDIEYTEKFFSTTLPIDRGKANEIYYLSLSVRDRYIKIQKRLIYMTFGLAKIFI